MVHHHAIGANPHRNFFQCLAHNALERLEIARLFESLRPRNAAIENVKDRSPGGNSCSTKHDRRLTNLAYFVNIGPGPFSVPARFPSPTTSQWNLKPRRRRCRSEPGGGRPARLYGPKNQ